MKHEVTPGLIENLGTAEAPASKKGVGKKGTVQGNDALSEANYLGYTIASVDIETLDLSQNCVVYEIGIIFTNVLPRAGRLWGTKDIATLLHMGETQTGLVFEREVLKISIIEQMLNGRTVDQGTLDFHSREMRKRGLEAADFFTAHEKNASRVAVARKLLCAAFAKHKPKEVWVNHTSFDIPRITGALFNNEVNALPWNFRAECDIATAKVAYRWRLNSLDSKLKPDPLRFPDAELDEKHDSIADCLYNLSALSVCLFDVIERKDQ